MVSLDDGDSLAVVSLVGGDNVVAKWSSNQSLNYFWEPYRKLAVVQGLQQS